MTQISTDIQQLEPFGLALATLFQQFSDEKLFVQFPAKQGLTETTQQLREGRYLFKPSDYQFQDQLSERMMTALFALFQKHLPDRTKALTHLQNVFASKQIEVRPFLTHVLNNQGNAIFKIIQQFGLEEGVTIFLAVYLSRPFRKAAAHSLTESLNLQNWLCGYCPVCGHWPSLSLIAPNEGHRTLWCMHCGTSWPFKRAQCVYCLNEQQDSLEILNLESEENYRLRVCNRCRHYLKEVRSHEPPDKFSLDTLYLGTALLDFLAKKEGYVEESPLTVRYNNPAGNEHLAYIEMLKSSNLT